jgi:hypothetical protein
MRRQKDRLQWQKVSGQPLVVHDLRLTPQSQVLIICFPWGAFVHNRPAAMLVEQHGQMDYLPIVDRTRRIQLWLFGLGLLISIVSFVQLARRKGNGL